MNEKGEDEIELFQEKLIFLLIFESIQSFNDESGIYDTFTEEGLSSLFESVTNYMEQHCFENEAESNSRLKHSTLIPLA